MTKPQLRRRQAAPRAAAPVGGSGHVLRTDSPLVGVLTGPAGRHLVAVRAIAAGTRLFRIEGRVVALPTRHSLQVAPGVHLDQGDARDEHDLVARFFWRYMDHHCEPSTAIRDREAIALRDIVPGEAITFDYNTTEDDMAEPFACHCGSARCVGLVRGARHRMG